MAPPLARQPAAVLAGAGGGTLTPGATSGTAHACSQSFSQHGGSHGPENLPRFGISTGRLRNILIIGCIYECQSFVSPDWVGRRALRARRTGNGVPALPFPSTKTGRSIWLIAPFRSSALPFSAPGNRWSFRFGQWRARFEDRATNRTAKDYWVRNINNPRSQFFLPRKRRPNGASGLIWPGGGIRELGHKRKESKPAVTSLIWEWRRSCWKLSPGPRDKFALLAKNPPAPGRPAPMRLIRSRAQEWKSIPTVSASSVAGGEVASLLSWPPARATPTPPTRLTVWIPSPISKL